MHTELSLSLFVSKVMGLQQVSNAQSHSILAVDLQALGGRTSTGTTFYACRPMLGLGTCMVFVSRGAANESHGREGRKITQTTPLPTVGGAAERSEPGVREKIAPAKVHFPKAITLTTHSLSIWRPIEVGAI